MERILVIENDPSLCKALSIGLASDEWQVDTASTAAAGLHAARRMSYDILLVDIRPGDMDGTEIIRNLKIISPDAMAIVLTEHATKASTLEAIRLGVAGYLEKPLDLESIRETIRGALARRRPDRISGTTSGNPVSSNVSELSHQIGNHLMAARGSAELAIFELSLGDTGRLKHHLGRIVEACDKIGAIKRQMVHPGRPPRARAQPVELARVLGHCIGSFDGLAGARGVSIHRDFLSGEVWVAGDRFELEQAFNNLLHNALDAMSKVPERRLRILLDRQPPDAVVAIEDTGCGIPQPLLQHVFGQHITTKPDGHGLGLHIVERIVTCHGGKVRIDSRKDIGTKVTVALPMIPQTDAGCCPRPICNPKDGGFRPVRCQGE